VDEIVVVSSVQGGTPADGLLEPGDEIVEVDGVVVEEPADVTEAVQRAEPGDTVTVEVVREGAEQSVPIVTTTSPRDPERAYLGITVGTTYRAPFELDISLDGVGGPSAGLFFSLGIVDKLTPGELTGGRTIAGTGTITPDGVVGAIGGIEQKMPGARDAGATLFLAPAENCADVLAARVPDGLTVARVETLAGAVQTIEDYVAGRPVTPCS
jgi:PDZ domain-containing protein